MGDVDEAESLGIPDLGNPDPHSEGEDSVPRPSTSSSMSGLEPEQRLDEHPVTRRQRSISPIRASTTSLVSSSTPSRPPLLSTSSSSSSVPSFAPDPLEDLPPPHPQSQLSPDSALTPSKQQQQPHQLRYKSARLTNDDLPRTKVHVEGSTIRPNDRGKEVLSFIIGVQLQGKEPWKVEKLYSDVLTLDVRVRGGIGKTAGKKIAPLPDNKLFKDNAPAKVDQRKVCIYDSDISSNRPSQIAL